MRGKKTRVFVILVIMMMVFALMPVQTVWAEDRLCPECGQPGKIRGFDPAPSYHGYYCETPECSFFDKWFVLQPHFGGTATCTAKAVCEVCRSEYGDLDLSKHTGTSTVTGKKAATCTEAGYTGDTTWDCCGAEVKGETIAALGHKGGTATCTAKAVCEVCNEEYGEPLGHSWGAWTVTKEATTSEEGIETRVCKNDSSHTETRKIAKKEENKEEVVEEESEEKATKANSESKTKKTSTTATTDAQPQTGDESQSTWIIMMMLSAALLIALIRRRTHQGTN